MLKANEYLQKITPYVPGKPIEEVQREFGLKKVIKLASNENNLGLPSSVIKKIKKTVFEAFLYPDGTCFELKKSLAKHYELTEDNFVLGNGSDEILQLIALTYLQDGDEVLLSEGTFSEYKFVAQIVNAGIRAVPLKDYTYDLDGFLKQVTSKTKVIFLCNPNNPTGTYFSQAKLVTFLKKISPEALIVMDEAYYEYASGDDYPETIPLLKEYPNLIILRTFSKIFSLAGFRIGFGIAHPEIIKSLNTVRQPFNINYLAQKAAVEVLKQQGWLSTVFKFNEAGKKYLYAELAKLKVKYLPTKTNFIFIETDRLGVEIFRALLKKGIIIRPMAGFGFEKAIRVSIGTLEECKAFIKEFKKVL